MTRATEKFGVEIKAGIAKAAAKTASDARAAKTAAKTASDAKADFKDDAKLAKEAKAAADKKKADEANK